MNVLASGYASPDFLQRSLSLPLLFFYSSKMPQAPQIVLMGLLVRL
jgi:hypothetical protein